MPPVATLRTDARRRPTVFSLPLKKTKTRRAGQWVRRYRGIHAASVPLDLGVTSRLWITVPPEGVGGRSNSFLLSHGKDCRGDGSSYFHWKFRLFSFFEQVRTSVGQCNAEQFRAKCPTSFDCVSIRALPSRAGEEPRGESGLSARHRLSRLPAIRGSASVLASRTAQPSGLRHSEPSLERAQCFEPGVFRAMIPSVALVLFLFFSPF